MSDRRRIHVVAGVLRDGPKVLLAQRPQTGHLAGFWEFPGGKVEPGESRLTALRRELDEEIGIDVRAAHPLIRLVHDYDDRVIDLDVWVVDAWEGTPSGREGQAIEWAAIAELGTYQLPPADEPVRTALRCGDRYLITPEPGDAQAFAAEFENTLTADRGIELVQLRIKATPLDAHRKLIERCTAIARRAGVRILLNGQPEEVRRFDVDGVHLPSAALASLNARPTEFELVAASTHDAAQLAQAERVADFAVLSPVCPTRSHPGAQGLGWEAFEQLVSATAIPVFALGGMTIGDCTHARQVGGQGIAAISGLWLGGRDGQ
ncbi:MAG: Nudix family hydrolase [Gammaproteobacteria bacterium]|nr:Nudix family hydrolase [Gammaproteobacteria bacterium]